MITPACVCLAAIWIAAPLMDESSKRITASGSQSERKIRFDLNSTELYKPTPLQRDEGGLVIAGSNSSKTIRTCTSINGISVRDLQQRMRPNNQNANGSVAGFLGKDEQLLDVLVADNDYVMKAQLTHRQLAIPLIQLTNKAVKLGLFKPVEFEHAGTKWRATIRGSRGYQLSPFDDGTKTNLDVSLTNLDNGRTLRFSPLVPMMIERYGFYEGTGTPYRVAPSKIIEVLGLSVSESLPKNRKRAG